MCKWSCTLVHALVLHDSGRTGPLHNPLKLLVLWAHAAHFRAQRESIRRFGRWRGKGGKGELPIALLDVITEAIW